MQLEFKMIDDILIICPHGEIDHHFASKIREEIDGSFDAFKCKDMIFDMTGVTFADSSGIAIIMGRYKKLKETGGRVVVCGCSKYMERIFEMAGIFTLIAKAESLEAAINLFECRGDKDDKE